MTSARSLVACIALVTIASLGLVAGPGAASAAPAGAAAVGQCNALAGRALGLVHRIDQGNLDLCEDLLDLFNIFAGAGCIDLLLEGKLFLTRAVGQYQLACQVFVEDCGGQVPEPVCVFD
jgi:hypothetical protein